MPKEPTRIWITIENKDVIDFINQPALQPEMLAHFCKYNPQLINEAVQAIATVQVAEQGLSVVPINVFEQSVKDKDSIECLLLVDGEPKDIEKFVRLMNARRIQQEFPEVESTAYEAMQKSAFNLMRKNNIKNFSEEELHRVFKHAKEQLLYRSIVRSAIEDGLTIDTLYAKDREHGLDR